MFKKSKWSIILIIYSCILFSCNSDDGQKSCNPQYTVSVLVNLSLPLYFNLNNPNGWVYVKGEGTGTRGLIVVNTGNGFKAYDRNSPHICPTNNSTLEVVDDIKMYSPEDGAEWILTTGEPIKIADRAPRTYQTSLNGNVLEIFN